MNDKEKFEEETLAEFIEMTGIPKEKIGNYGRVHSFNFATSGETYEFKTPGLVIQLRGNFLPAPYPVFYFPNKPHDISEPVLSHSETSGLIYVYFGGKKFEITKYAIEAVEAVKALEQKPTTKNCRTCKNFGSHHGICEICKDNKCWIPTTKNDVLDKIRAEIIDTGAYEQEVHGKTEFLEGINYCLSVIDKYIGGKEQKDDTK